MNKSPFESDETSFACRPNDLTDLSIL